MLPHDCKQRPAVYQVYCHNSGEQERLECGLTEFKPVFQWDVAHPCVLSVSPALSAIPQLAILLDAEVASQARLVARPEPRLKAVLAWGKKPSAIKAAAVAQKMQLPLLRLEDGFLRSVELGMHSAPYSVVVDDLGIYYDAAVPSRLEQYIKQPYTPEQIERAGTLISLWQQSRVSKYNHSREHPVPDTPYVLVVDQTFGDAAIGYGLANAESFQQMLAAALDYDPEIPVLVKTHPDVFTGKKQGYFRPEQLKHPRITVLTTDIHAPALLEKAAAVFCVTSQMGFEALLWQKPVFTFGMPFYAGWGLTTDALLAPDRRCPVSLEQLVYAALIAYPRYIHPETKQRCEVEDLLAWMALQRQQRQRLPEMLYSVKPSRWKRAALQRFVQGSTLKIVDLESQIPATGWQLKWGANNTQHNTVRVEDGFIRSVGLGADLIRPLSWVFDAVGIYYDATRPSALEQMLQHEEFSELELQRALVLQQLLVSSKVTKYNIGSAHWQRPVGKRVLLVPGQVESDASIKLGSPVLKTNLALLQAVRAANPDAYIVYKPHPDVLAGLRKAGDADKGETASYYCDEMVTDQDIATLLEQVDEVHTLTSLAGFEALLRGKVVTCYGQPFYSGWGLTHDIYPNPRRGVQRSLPELIAAALIRYPTYLNWDTGYYSTPEQTIESLAKHRLTSDKKLPWWRYVVRKFLALKRF